MILLDFYSYSCMNCRRSLLEISKLAEAYRKEGLKTLLIHPPEWEYEKKRSTVSKGYKGELPLILDREKEILRHFRVSFWPAQILLKNGRITYKHIGEGSYRKLEMAIVQGLDAVDKKIFLKEKLPLPLPAVYLGIRKGNNSIKKIVRLEGKWERSAECLKGTGIVHISMRGRVFYLVAGSNRNKTNMLTINGKKDISVSIPGCYRIAGYRIMGKKMISIQAKKAVKLYAIIAASRSIRGA